MRALLIRDAFNIYFLGNSS